MQIVSLWDDTRAKLETPERVDLHLELANVGSRGLALLIDSALRYGVLFVFYIIYVLVNEVSHGHFVLEMGKQGFFILGTMLFFGSEWLYFTCFEIFWNGQTPGKRVLRLRVIKEDGAPVTGIEVFARNLMRPLDTTGPMALVGMALIFFGRHGQRFGDMLARTIVIREHPIDWSLFDLPEPGDLQGTIRLEAVEFEALQRFLQRQADLDPAVRESIAGQLRASLRVRVAGSDLAAADGPAAPWLEELARRI